MILPFPIACRSCGAPVEEARRCYAVPTCYTCLPPPPPLPVVGIRWRAGRPRTGDRFYVYGVTAEEWTARYGVEPFSHPCGECGRTLTTTLPFAQGQLRGLQAPPCECGNKQTPFALVRDPKHGDLFTRQP